MGSRRSTGPAARCRGSGSPPSRRRSEDGRGVDHGLIRHALAVDDHQTNLLRRVRLAGHSPRPHAALCRTHVHREAAPYVRPCVVRIPLRGLARREDELVRHLPQRLAPVAPRGDRRSSRSTMLRVRARRSTTQGSHDSATRRRLTAQRWGGSSRSSRRIPKPPSLGPAKPPPRAPLNERTWSIGGFCRSGSFSAICR